MAHFNHPASGFPSRVFPFFLDLFSAPFHVGDVTLGNDQFQCRLAVVSFICTQILLNVLRTFYDDLIQNKFQLGYVMAIGSGHDE